MILITPVMTDAGASNPPVLIDMKTIEYHVGRIPGPQGGSGFPDDFKEWRSVSDFDFRELAGSHDVWLKIPLPDDEWDVPALFLTAFLNGVDVYTGNTLIYSYGNMTAPTSPDFRYHMSHLIPLDGYEAGSSVYLNSVYPTRAGIGEIITISVGETSDLLDVMISDRDDLFRRSIIDVCIGFLMLIIGTGALFIFFIRRKERDYTFFSFGIFALSVGATYLSDANALFFLNLSPATHFYLKTLSFLLVPAGLFAFFGTMFDLNPVPSSIVTFLWLFHCAMAFAGLLFIDYKTDYTLFFLGTLVVNCTICILIILISGRTAAVNIRVTFIAFFLLYIVLTLLHFLELTNRIPYSYDVFGWGMIVFVFVLGYTLAKHYTSTYTTMQTVTVALEKSKADLLELQKENLSSQLEALKNQLDPHFLFNSFSTLSSIIEENPSTAVSFVQKLSSIYRYVLQTRVSTLVTLKEELDFIESYRFLMTKRFGSNFSITTAVPDSCHGCLVMPFSLQLLVENAVKHNVISRKKPLGITISIDNGYLVVTNTLQKKKSTGRSTQIGLSNIINRYRLITDNEVRISDGPSEFRVEIPLIKNEETDHECSDF